MHMIYEASYNYVFLFVQVYTIGLKLFNIYTSNTCSISRYLGHVCADVIYVIAKKHVYAK